MKNKTILEQLEVQEKEYLTAYPRTGTADLKIARAYWKGASVPAIAMDVPCAEATVYRAIRRVKAFLSKKNFYYEKLLTYVRENPPDYGDRDAASILEMLFCHYAEFNRFESDEIKDGFQRLYENLDEMSLKQLDQVIDTTCGLCQNYEKAGFVEGVKVGVRMGMEFYC